MDALYEWDRIIRDGAMSPLSPQELIDIGHKAALVAPEHRWEVMKEFAHALFTHQRLPTLDTLDDYVGLVVTVTHDCVAEQVLRDTELHLIGEELDRRKQLLYIRLASDKNNSSKEKRAKVDAKPRPSQDRDNRT